MSECCKSCGSVDLKITIMDHGPHYARIDCNDCGKFVKWGKKPVEMKPENQVVQEDKKYIGGHGMNKSILIGRLTKDPELRYTAANNTAVCSFTLAVDRRFKQKNGPEADFLPIVAWMSTAEFCGKYFKKGLRVAVFGSIQTRTWDDDQGVKHYVTEIVADEVGFADGKKEGNEANGGGSSGDRGGAGGGHHTQGEGQNPSQTPSPQGDSSRAGKMPWEN